MQMKIKLLVTLIIVLLISVTISGCIEEKIQNKGLITSSIKDFLLELDDLPDGFKKMYGGTDKQTTSEFSRYPEKKPVEYYAKGFSIGNMSNETGYQVVTCELNRFKSIEDAEAAFDPTIDYIITQGLFDIINDSIDIIGNESKGITKRGYNLFLIFRILNVIGLVSTENFAYTIELSEIVESRILESLN
jgi:hypothetical protein